MAQRKRRRRVAPDASGRHEYTQDESLAWWAPRLRAELDALPARKRTELLADLLARLDEEQRHGRRSALWDVARCYLGIETDPHHQAPAPQQ